MFLTVASWYLVTVTATRKAGATIIWIDEEERLRDGRMKTISFY